MFQQQKLRWNEALDEFVSVGSSQHSSVRLQTIIMYKMECPSLESGPLEKILRRVHGTGRVRVGDGALHSFSRNEASNNEIDDAAKSRSVCSVHKLHFPATSLTRMRAGHSGCWVSMLAAAHET